MGARGSPCCHRRPPSPSGAAPSSAQGTAPALRLPQPRGSPCSEGSELGQHGLCHTERIEKRLTVWAGTVGAALVLAEPPQLAAPPSPWHPRHVCVCWCSAVLARGRGAHPQPVPSLAHAARSSSPPRAPSDPPHSHPPRFSSTLLQEPPRRARVAPWGSRGQWPGGTCTRPPPTSPQRGYAPGVSFQSSESCSFSRASCCFTTSALSDSHFLQGNRGQSTAPGSEHGTGCAPVGRGQGAGCPAGFGVRRHLAC